MGISKYSISEEVLAETVNRFTYHKPKDESQTKRYEEIRKEALSLAVFIKLNTPPSREQSLAITDLENAVFWANAAIARNE